MRESEFHDMAKIENSHWWYVGRRSILKSYLNKLHLNKKSKILEIGSGTGSNIKLLNKFGLVSILEPNKIALNYFEKKKLKIENIKIGGCPNDLIYSEKFDLVCLFDVLEHIDEDKKTINNISNILESNGYIFLTVPAYQWLWSDHDVRLMHKRRYNIQKLKNILPKNLEIEYLTYFNTFLFPLAIFDRLIQKFFKIKNNSNFLFINFLFKKIFIFEKYILNFINFRFGLSILLILKINNLK